MPIYEFRCKCGHIFEKLCRASDTSNPDCPKCGGAGEKIFSSFSVGRSAASLPSAGCSMGEMPPGGG